MLYPTTEGDYFTYKELEATVKDTQTDKDGKLIFLYSSNLEEQHQYIEMAKDKSYKVLLLDSPIIAHLIQKLEGDKDKIAFARVDGDAVAGRDFNAITGCGGGVIPGAGDGGATRGSWV